MNVTLDEIKNLIERVAAELCTSKDEVRQEIQAAIDAAWDNPYEAIRERHQVLFPDGRPSVEDFIRKIIEQMELQVPFRRTPKCSQTN